MTSWQVKSTREMDWAVSPSPSVVRKRLELVGPQEAGRVTSVVRYMPDSEFPRHEHPDGEEILVLDGVFSDESGDYPKGTYILNPQGFAHAPRSKGGCDLLVKLKQFPGLARRQVRVYSSDPATWSEVRPGVAVCSLYEPLPGELDQESMSLVRLAGPSAQFEIPPQEAGLELFVTEGTIEVAGALPEGSGPDGQTGLGAGTWLKADSTATPTVLSTRAEGGAAFYFKRNHLAAAL